MRVTLYCHTVRSEDDGRTLAFLSHGEDDAATEITILAPFEAYEIDEALRGGFRYKVTFERLKE